MNKDIQKIIEELIKIDSSFQEKKTELEKLISEIIESKPNVEINPAFVVELKEQLHEKAETKKQNLFSNFFTMKSFKSFGAGAILTALILTPLFYSMWGQTNLSSVKITYNDGNLEASEETDGMGGLAQNSIVIDSLGSEAFGRLNLQNNQTDTSTGLGGGEKIVSDIAPKMMSEESAISSKMIAPYNPTQYKYIYEGDLKLEEKEITVFRKSSGNSKINANQLLSALNLELIDSSVFKNVTSQNISIQENREFGYSISLYNENGSNTVSIHKNWEKWPNPNNNCRDEKCYEKNRLKNSDVPSDEKLIEIANAFAKKLKIDMSPYGQPVVRKQNQFRDMALSSRMYIPDEMTVVYPILIDEQEVSDEQGNPAGLNINVDIRHKKAAGLNGLTIQEYDSGSYETVDLEKLKSAVERGTYRQYGYYPKDAKIVEVMLGEPQRILTKIWQWDNEVNQSKELLVPALYFPITDQPKTEDYFNREAIVIPLAADLYEENQVEPILYKNSIEPMIEPMPAILEEEAKG